MQVTISLLSSRLGSQCKTRGPNFKHSTNRNCRCLLVGMPPKILNPIYYRILVGIRLLKGPLSLLRRLCIRNPPSPRLLCNLFMYRFKITFASCFMMGVKPIGDDIPQLSARLGNKSLLQGPYFGFWALSQAYVYLLGLHFLGFGLYLQAYVYLLGPIFWALGFNCSHTSVYQVSLVRLYQRCGLLQIQRNL